MAGFTQAHVDSLLRIEKHRVDQTAHDFPYPGTRIVLALKSADGEEHFLLDLNRGRANQAKMTYQTRYRQTIVLARLDFAGSPHQNPDGKIIPCPHLHVYRAGFGDKWAEPISVASFPNSTNLYQSAMDFMTFCNVTVRPIFTNRLII